MNKVKSILSYYWDQNWITWCIVIGCGYFVIWMTDGISSIPGWFVNGLDPLLGIAGLLITLGLAIFYASVNWTESRPKKLIVHFINKDGLFIASCYNVNVLPNAELRALGLQVGQQMLGVQNVKFNPSINERRAARAVYVKDEKGRWRWIQLYEISFHLSTNEYNAGSQYYEVWNISGSKEDKKYFYTYAIPYHEVYNNLPLLLNEDQESITYFNENVISTASPAKANLYVLNSAIVTGAGRYRYDYIDIKGVKSMLLKTASISAIGHEATAQVISDLVEVSIPHNRISIVMNVGDQAIVCKLADRIEEGKVYTKMEMNNMKIEWGLMTKEA